MRAAQTGNKAKEAAARRDLKYARGWDYIEGLVTQQPALTIEQRQRLAQLLVGAETGR